MTKKNIKYPARALRWKFIREFLEVNKNADVLNQLFHDSYHATFPQYETRFTMWGSQPVRQAVEDLREMYNSGMLDRARITLEGNWRPGFPKSCFSYSLLPKYNTKLTQE